MDANKFTLQSNMHMLFIQYTTVLLTKKNLQQNTYRMIDKSLSCDARDFKQKQTRFLTSLEFMKQNFITQFDMIKEFLHIRPNK